MPTEIQVNPIRSGDDWQHQRMSVLLDSGAFHAEIAAARLHWFHPQRRAWLTREDAVWRGWDEQGAAVELADWTPWQRAFDDSAAPYYRWFCGGLTNAAFNEVDRHLLTGHGGEPAYFYEGDRWDSAADNGRGAPVEARVLTRRQLFVQSCLAALALRRLGLRRGDRIALNMPNILDQIIWTEGAKRLGIIYTAVFGGFSDKTLADRIENAGARVVITADGAVRNAETVPFKEAYSDPALDRFIALDRARDVVRQTLAGAGEAALAAATLQHLALRLPGEITVAPGDIMRVAGEVLAQQVHNADRAADLRALLALALAQTPRRVEKVIVVRHVGITDLPWTAGRDVWAHDLLADAAAELLANFGAAADSTLDSHLATFTDTVLWARLNALCPCLPLEANTPLFIIYTSGSTGKPKGVVHVHGYLGGLAHTMAVSFDAVPGRDVIYVVADPGWITGQSYLIAASLAMRIPGVVTEGAPVFPHAGRFASIIERYRVTIFKAGVTFLKSVMANPQNVADVQRYRLTSLRVATFCAEPVSPTVQAFGMELMTPRYINSYWATEHGGIAWTHAWGNPAQPVKPDTHCYPLPWVLGEVWVPTGEPRDDGRCHFRVAEPGEKGEVVITQPYPYMARTLWGNAEQVGDADWRGDAQRWAATYWNRFCAEDGRPLLAYVQGDFAIGHADGAFSFHGRSDDVINVSGHRMGTEEIEGAILKDKQIYPESPVGNCIVIGAPHPEKGLTPLAFILEARGRSFRGDDERRLKELVRDEKGAVSVPSDFIVVPAFPETRSGKYMRRFLKNLILGEALGDTTTLRNPECLPEIARRIADWQKAQERSQRQQLFEDSRFLRVEYQALPASGPAGQDDGSHGWLATIHLRHPPVNALSERVLDELTTAVTHLNRRDDIAAVVITGQGGVFAAGADVRQLLEDVTSLEQARALAAKAHQCFNLIENAGKPYVAAIDGVALGGGCELALACHHRVAHHRARLGQPEINLFLTPGYGGTQRLVRRIGAGLASREGDPDWDEHLQTALTLGSFMLLSGRSFSADTLHTWGLIDRLTRGSTLAAARRYAQTLALVWQAGADHQQHCYQQTQHWPAEGFAEFQARMAGQAPAESLLGLTEADPADPHATAAGLPAPTDVARALAQHAGTGRAAVAQAILDLLQLGFAQGYAAGLAAEIDTFAQWVMDSRQGARHGIPLFLEKRSPPLPARPRLDWDAAEQAAAARRGDLLPIGSPFAPGVTPIPPLQHAHAVVKHLQTGAAQHGQPHHAEVAVVLPTPRPGPNQVLLYVLASEINFNDVWAITGIPISVFDEHDEDVHVTGSGGLGLVVELGEAVADEGRLALGDIVAVYSGVSDLLDPNSGADPMATRFVNQGYQTPNGSHQQFMVVDGPQCFVPPSGLPLEHAASYILAAGTVYRCLFRALDVLRPAPAPAEHGAANETNSHPPHLLVEGAASGTGAWAVKLGLAHRLRVTGIVSSADRRAQVEGLGAAAVQRAAAAFTRVPADPGAWAAWEAAGEEFVAAVRAAGQGHGADFVVSHAGERAFPRSFQAMAPGGVLAFYGASSGYLLTFIGKPGAASPQAMLNRAALRPGESVLVWYGAGPGSRHAALDEQGLAAIEAARSRGARIAVITDRDAERDFVLSLGFGDAIKGVVSLEELGRRQPEFRWSTAGMPELPDPARDIAGFKEAVRSFAEYHFKPLAQAVGRVLKTADNPRGIPALVLERAEVDTLALSVMLSAPHSGRVVYHGNMAGRRYSFYAQQVWMRQRRIIMPSAAIHGTHLCNAAEVVAVNQLIEAGVVDLPPLHLFDWAQCAEAHQAIWDNRLPELTGGANKAVLNHALPELGLRTRDELFEAWAANTE